MSQPPRRESLFKVLRGGFRSVEGSQKSDEDKFLRETELRALLKVTRDETPHGSVAYDLFAIAGNLGLRSGEMVKITFEDFAYLQHDYLVVHTLKRRAKIDDRLYVGEEEKRLLLEIQARRRERIRGELLFPFGTRAVRHYFAYYAQLAGIHPNVSFHSLRHTAARMILAAGGGDLRFVKSRLRHSLKDEPSHIYVKPTAEEMIAVANRKGAIR